MITQFGDWRCKLSLLVAVGEMSLPAVRFMHLFFGYSLFAFYVLLFMFLMGIMSDRCTVLSLVLRLMIPNASKIIYLCCNHG
jgi:hypothetical protein